MAMSTRIPPVFVIATSTFRPEGAASLATSAKSLSAMKLPRVLSGLVLSIGSGAYATTSLSRAIAGWTPMRSSATTGVAPSLNTSPLGEV